jgi:hypothetical protein
MTEKEIEEMREGLVDVFQQGDMIVGQVFMDLDLLEKQGGNILIHGQNDHCINGGTIYKDKESGELFVHIPDGTVGVFYHTDKHKGHNSINAPEGIYWVYPIVELGMLDDMVRPVID